tara:strand:- start:1164 stop:1283 length:120 start_codon:yes stop_codon:yes gene_type:complete
MDYRKPKKNKKKSSKLLTFENLTGIPIKKMISKAKKLRK